MPFVLVCHPTRARYKTQANSHTRKNLDKLINIKHIKSRMHTLPIFALTFCVYATRNAFAFARCVFGLCGFVRHIQHTANRDATLVANRETAEAEAYRRLRIASVWRLQTERHISRHLAGSVRIHWNSVHTFLWEMIREHFPPHIENHVRTKLLDKLIMATTHVIYKLPLIHSHVTNLTGRSGQMPTKTQTWKYDWFSARSYSD